jgi:hypothetical protein
MAKRRMRVFLIDEDEKVELEVKDVPFDPDFMAPMYLRFREKRMEIGWAEIEQMADGRLEVDMTLVGSFIVGDGAVPDLTKYKGTIPGSLRKD